MGHGVAIRHRTRDDYVALGSQLKSISVNSLSADDRKLIDSDPALKSIVRDTPTDRVIRGEDFGKFFDRMHALDVQRGTADAKTLNKADAMYQSALKAGSATGDPLDRILANINARAPRTGINAAPANPKADQAKLDKTLDDGYKLEKAGKYGEAAAKLDDAAMMMTKGIGDPDLVERQASSARRFAHAGELYTKAGDELAAKGDKAGAEAMYKKAGDAYANAVQRMGVRPNLATLAHWDANLVSDWGLAGIEAYQKAGLTMQKNGDKRTIGQLDVNKVESGIAASYGVDRGLELGNRWMRFADALVKTDKPAALEAYKAAKGNYESSIAEDKKFYQEGLKKHVEPMELATMRIAATEAAIARDGGTKIGNNDYRSHLIDANQPVTVPSPDQLKTAGNPPQLTTDTPAMTKARATFRALQATDPAMPDNLRKIAVRDANETLVREMAWVEKNGTPAQKAAYAAKAADFFDDLGDTARAKDAHAMAARANVQLAEKEADPWAKADLLANAAREMKLSGQFDPKEIEKTHAKAAAAYLTAAAKMPDKETKGDLLEHAGDEFRQAGKEKEAASAYRDAGKAYLESVGEKPAAILSSKTPAAVTTRDLAGVVNDYKANMIGKSAAMFEKAGTAADKKIGLGLRERSEALHNLGLRERFKDKIFVPAIALDGGEITPKSIRDFENSILAKNGGDPKKAAETFDALAASPNAGDKASYFKAAAERMRQLQVMKDAGVQDVENPPTRKNLADYAKARGDFWRKQKDSEGNALSEREIARNVAGELLAVTSPFYAHSGSIGKDIDYKPGGKNTITVDPDGKQLGDCEVYAYDIALAMEAAGFKASTETRTPNAGGASHVVVNLHSEKSGAHCGTISNERYYHHADAAFTSVGMKPGTHKDAVVRTRAEDPRAPK